MSYRLHSVIPSLDLLDDESATNQIDRTWFWGALVGILLYRGELQVFPCRIQSRGQRMVLCPLVQDQWRLYLMGWYEFFRKSTLGHAGRIMDTSLVQLDQPLYPPTQLKKLSFLLVMMRFIKEVQYHQHWNIREERQRCFQKIECLNDSSPSSRKIFPPWYHIRVGTKYKQDK